MPPQVDLSGVSVLVTGAAGFLGSHLVDALLAHGARVRGLDNFATGRRENLAHCRGRIELLVGDLRDLPTCWRACRGVSLIFHLAALGSVARALKDPAATLSVNIGGTANLLSAARDSGARRVVFASSSRIYGDSSVRPRRESEVGRAECPYALSKQMGEELGEHFHRVFGLEVVSLRYFNVYGPRQDPEGAYAAVIPRFFQALLSGAEPVIYGDGEQGRDFTYVSDAVGATLKAALAPAEVCGHAYNVASGVRTTVQELLERIGEVLGVQPQPRFEAERRADQRESQGDPTLAAEQLDFRSQVDLAGGLTRAAAYYRKLISPTSGSQQVLS